MLKTSCPNVIYGFANTFLINSSDLVWPIGILYLLNWEVR